MGKNEWLKGVKAKDASWVVKGMEITRENDQKNGPAFL